MYAIYRLRADELDQRFLDAIKRQSKARKSKLPSAKLPRVWRMRRPISYVLLPIGERLLKAMENVAQGRNLKGVDPVDLS